MAREGRKFEKLILLLESIDLDNTAVITSPDYLIDKDSGVKREVDISIRYKIGTISLLIILECRDRTSVQGSPWVEEVSSKMKSVNADKAIMISSSGFSEPAHKKAKHNCIELRTYSQIDKNDIFSWLKFEYLTLVQKRYQLDYVGIDIYEDEEIEESIIPKLEKYRNIKALDDQFKLNVDDKIVNLNYIFWDSLGVEADTLFKTFPVKEINKVAKQFIFNFTNRKSCFQLFAGERTIDIKRITFNTHCWRDVEQIPISKVFNYRDSTGAILYNGIEFKFEYSEKKQKIIFVETVDSTSELRKISVKLFEDKE